MLLTQPPWPRRPRRLLSYTYPGQRLFVREDSGSAHSLSEVPATIRRMVTVYANQTVVRGEDLPDVIRAAEVLGIGVKIENVMVPIDEEGSYSLEWVVTRDDEVPVYDDWEGRYEESEEEDEELVLSSVE
ncbi:hypothetical protein GCM10009764_80230 [Nocardia ninae]|uniref:Uncharacterized protein n=2 Tax=Nocardia TaxID=1817 RepID=A0A511MNV3_9NOCA|nr:hypothetical protein NN4_68110 [Nocardia ninae NBRC 108245]